MEEEKEIPLVGEAVIATNLAPEVELPNSIHNEAQDLIHLSMEEKL